MREITVISGKGGTGKTTITASLAVLAAESRPAKQLVLADCDVDAANLGLLLRPTVRESHEFRATRQAVIDPKICTGCGLCVEACRPQAITVGDDGLPAVDPLACEGCGLCGHLCPVGAAEMKDVVTGQWFMSDTPYGPFVHARLVPGGENSGKLVTIVRNEARRLAQEEERDLVLVDGPPGIGCPVIASLAGVATALVITEPTLSAIHDLERVLEVCRHFEIPAMVGINRCDLDASNRRSIKDRCEALDLPVVAEIPYDPGIIRAAVKGLTPVEDGNAEFTRHLRGIWERLLVPRDQETGVRG